VPLTIHPMSLGSVSADTSYLAFSWTPGTKMRVPYLSYLILGGSAPIVVDAGLRVDGPLPPDSPRQIGPEHALEAQLGNHGVEPADVGLVVFTHLHADHTGHADRFPNARLLVQRSELQSAAVPVWPAYMYDRLDVGKIVGTLWSQVELLDGDTEVAPGIRCVQTGGHSVGHQMLYVDVASGTAIITGDNVCVAEPAMEHGLPTGYVVDMADAVAAVERVRRDATHVLPGHDPKVFETYPAGVS
jgi:glyoxylase-like metal-dependent hydrolase (beta-lactamase superfamily II)